MSTVQSLDERHEISQITATKLRDRVNELLHAGMTRSQLVVELGIKPRELDRWVEGDGDLDGRIKSWLVEREAAAANEEPGFVMTPAVKKIIDVFETARTEPCLGVVVGAAGVGKSSAAIEYASDGSSLWHSGTPAVYVTTGGVISTPAAVFGRLAEQLGMVGHAYRLHSLVEVIARNFRPGEVLLVDEAQSLNFFALEALRCHLLDEHRIGVVLIGNERLYSDLHGKGRAARFAQLVSREGARLRLPNPTPADVDALLSAWGISGREERAFAVTIGTVAGGLRVLGRVLKRARAIAGSIGKRVDAQVLKTAARSAGEWDA